jgi:hypothetical protein
MNRPSVRPLKEAVRIADTFTGFLQHLYDFED